MKSLKDYSLNIPEEEYHNYPAWSYSIIARYAKEGFSSLTTLHDRIAPTPSMEFGSLFDSILTKGKKTLDEYVVDDTAVSPAEKAVYDRLLALGNTVPFAELSPAVVLSAADECAYYPKYKMETRLEKLDKSSAYYNVRRLGKKIVSKQDWEDALQMAKTFRENPYLKELFGTKNSEEKEYLYQTQFVVDYMLPSGKTVKVKIMPDLMVVNHDDKTIQLVDLKTSSMPAYDFGENFLKFRYDIQACEYSDVMQEVINQIPEYADYTILPYLFTDISRTDKVPVTFVYDQTDDSQKDGFTFSSGEKTYTYKNWKDILDEILVYEEQQAKVPVYITTEGPNDLLSILSMKR